MNFGERSKSMAVHDASISTPSKDYINKAFESIVKDKKNWIGIGIPSSMGREPIDGVAMARARNKIRVRLRNNGVSPRAAEVMNLDLPMKTVEPQSARTKLSPEEMNALESKHKKLIDDLAELVNLPEKLFDGAAVKNGVNLYDLQAYTKDLEAYLVVAEQREDSSEEIDEAEYERLHK